jgi:hypothetical protein
MPNGLNGSDTAKLGAAYKQLNAPFGAFGTDTLTASTTALASTDLLKYDSIESQIANLTFARNQLAGTIASALNDASFGNGKIDGGQAKAWIKAAQDLLDAAHTLAGS